jgi:hypothetical protein
MFFLGAFYFTLLFKSPFPHQSLQQNLKIQRGKFTDYFLIYKGLE